MELELAPALFIQPYGSGIIAPGKPTQQNATATKSINVLPVDVSAGVHSGHHPPPSPASRTRVGMTGAQPPAHTQPKNPEREIRGGQGCGFNVSALPAQAADANRAHDRGRAGSLAAVADGRHGRGSGPRTKQLLRRSPGSRRRSDLRSGHGRTPQPRISTQDDAAAPVILLATRAGRDHFAKPAKKKIDFSYLLRYLEIRGEKPHKNE